MGYKKGLEKYKIFGQLKLTLFGPKKKKKMKKKKKKKSAEIHHGMYQKTIILFLFEKRKQ